MNSDHRLHNTKILGLLAIVFVFLCSVSVSAADNSSIADSDHYIKLDPIGNHTIGEVFFINGTTNLPVSENLTVNIALMDWIQRGNREKTSSGGNPPGEGVTFRAISISPYLPGTNQWSANITGTINVSGEYFLNVFSYVNYTCGYKCSVPEVDVYEHFFLLPENNSQFSHAITQIPPVILPSTSATLVPSPTQSTPLPLVLPIAAIATIVVLISVYGKKGK
jgi:hypothetical protein